jgi:Zn-dependent M28 family amino/carboxypeptidase
MLSIRYSMTRRAKLFSNLYLALAISMGVVACGGGGNSAVDPATASSNSAVDNSGEVAIATAAANEDKIKAELDNTEEMDQDERDKACKDRNNNSFKKLLSCVTLDGVRTHQAKLRDIALANNGTRVAGTKGFDESADYAEKVFKDAGYNVTRQQFAFQSFIELPGSTISQVSPTSTVTIETKAIGYSGSGKITATVSTPSQVLGCEAADFAGFPAGNIALIKRGTCTFLIKANNAIAAGASAVVIYNREPGLISGNMGPEFTSTVVVTSVLQTVGEQLSAIPNLQLSINVSTVRGTATTTNIIAESKEGDANNVVMVGAHLDSVAEGPGINDNGSGSAAILEVAKQLGKVKPRNKLRFALWSAEESGLVGSEKYVELLPEAEKNKIALYLNFDMIGSPNHVFFIYDGDNSDGVGAGAGPAGSTAIEKTFETFYNKRGVSFKGTDFDGRSDYGPFIAAGIPSGGLFTGAEGTKTVAEAEVWGGISGTAYDPCYHKACDNYGNTNLFALDVNADAVAYATLQFAMSTNAVNGIRGTQPANKRSEKAQSMNPPVPAWQAYPPRFNQ